MKKITNYSVLLNHTRIDEFDECCRLLDTRLGALLPAAQDTILNTFYTPFHTNYQKEEAIMKPILASPLTPVLEHVDRERKIEVNAICHTIETNSKNEFEPDRKAAALNLIPAVHAYRGIGHRTLTGTTSYERNFIYDVTQPEHAADVATLGLAAQLTRAESLNQQFEDYLLEREHKWQAQHPGSLKPLRREISMDFRNLAECTNLHYLATVLNGAPSAAIEAIIDEVNDIFRPFRRSLAHRGVHGTSDSDDYQNPENSLPEYDGPLQAPDGNPHVLDPNEHPAMGE
ncbi:MAG: DUF6261 family protein [Tannerellaceae bacterium]|jgi:hypothetical protein|nr:DUF6261 family protein [Tannerellaceae bacterium]